MHAERTGSKRAKELLENWDKTLQQTHFAYPTDAGQSFYPSLHSPSVFLVGTIQDDMQAEEMRAFYSKGDVGVCLHQGVWHTMPICVEGDDIYQTTRGDQDELDAGLQLRNAE